MSIGSSTNHAFARDYWYITAAIVALLGGIQTINTFQARSRLRCTNTNPTVPLTRLAQTWATTTAIVREMSHPQLYIPIKGLRWTTPLPLGRILILFIYWAVVAYFMAYDVSKKDVYYWERIGYRNGWVTMAQLPMLYLLAMKINPVAHLIGTSHERINWLHRWVSRTMLITATVHGFHFWTMWTEADFLSTALKITPLVKYGLGAWGILLWLAVSGILPIRRLAYEVWVAQHVVASIVMLWLVYVHIPSSARYLLWMSISFLVFDRIARWILLGWRNLHFRPNTSSCQGQKRVGHNVSIKAVGSLTTLVTIKDVHFKWKAGQYIYLWLPRVGLLESHPYTIACAHQPAGSTICTCNSIQLIIRAHTGFSKRLHTHALKHEADMTGFVSGPYGVARMWDAYETLVLIGASTGASFTLPILESVANKRGCVRKVEAVFLSRTMGEVEFYIGRAREAARIAKGVGVDVDIHIAITGETSSTPGASDSDQNEEKHQQKCCCCNCGPKPTNTENPPPEDKIYTSRPDIEALMQTPVEAASGETAVVVCGGKALVARIRNCVVRLSDERAVHKGTGAQGIYLHVEEYAF